MNYLAHARLSFNDPQVLAGNMISDYVKGKRQYDYPLQIQKGIKLHREIDNFTDAHESIKEMKNFFRPVYGLYAGVFTDIICDYFLANDQQEFATPQELQSFAARVYANLDEQLALLPENFKQHFFYMKKHDWLYSYQFEHIIQKSFEGIARRATRIAETATAFTIFTCNMEALKSHYTSFFPALKDYSLRLYHQLLKAD